MGSEDNGKAAQAQVAGEPQAQGDETAAQVQVTSGAGYVGGGDADKARADYETALKERKERIAELEGETAEAATSAERLRTEMDGLRRQGEEQRIGFELQIAGTRNVKAARALLSNFDDDIEKLKAV